MSIRMEDTEVYEEAHKLIFQYIKERRVTGLRIDHPDGLYNPDEYFARLQKSAQQLLQKSERAPLYVLIEKILEHGEWLNTKWTVHGTTGYEFMNLVNGIFVEQVNETVTLCNRMTTQ